MDAFANQLIALLQQSLQQQSLPWVLLAAFVAGVIGALLPCSVSFLPLTVAYMGGSAQQGNPLGRAMLFVLGLCLSLTVLGLLAALVGVSLGTALSGWGTLALGLLAIVMGAHMLGWLHLPLPQLFKQLPQVPAGRLGAVLLGFVFGLSASPCATPALTLLLGYTARQQDALMGGLALFAYALGQSILLLVAGWGAASLKRKAHMLKMGHWINQFSGVVLLGLGTVWVIQGWPTGLTFF
jgi:cytochrome c-type biogenesis protein